MVPWGGIACCLGAAVSYAAGKSYESEADALNSATRVYQLKDLAQIYDTRCKDVPLVVTVSGQVGSDTPIIYMHSGLQGVIARETAEQNFMIENESGGWKHDSLRMAGKYKEVPWYLDDRTGRVHVVGAQYATGFVLDVAKRTFEESGGSLAPGTWNDFQKVKDFLSDKKIKDFKILGVTRSESVLPTGKSLTVVGEAVKDNIGMIQIQRPHNGPFYVSPDSIDKLIEDLRASASFYKWASVGLTLLGASLIVGERRPT